MHKQKIRKLLESETSTTGKIIKISLSPLAYIYKKIVLLRRKLYQKNFFYSYKPSIPCISVGNITAGGTGKTPMVMLLTDLLLSYNKKVAILLRGYKKDKNGNSDEASLYKQKYPDVFVGVGANRIKNAILAEKKSCDIILLDDGFQHIALKRTYDIVLVDALCPWGGGKLIPAGLLREPLNVLKNANLIIITRSDQTTKHQLANIQNTIRNYNSHANILHAKHVPSLVYKLGEKFKTYSPDFLSGKNITALCAIARPESFVETIKSCSGKIIQSYFFADHDIITKSTLETIINNSKLNNSMVLVTEKDAARSIFNDSNFDNVFVLAVKQVVDNNLIIEKVLKNIIK